MSSNEKKFCNPSGGKVRIALLSGHITIIDGDWAPLHKRFWPEAFAKGCISEEMYENISKMDSPNERPNVLKVIDAIKGMVEGGDAENFTSDGVPNANILSTVCGFDVSQEMRDNAWAAYQKDHGGVTDPNVDNTPNVVDVIAAIGRLVDGGNEEDFIASGSPNATILSKMCGFDVSSTMRDEAWDAYQAEHENDGGD